MAMTYLEGEGISVSVMPERGDKITSIVDREREREWLEQPRRDLVGPTDQGTSFDDGDMCGWDEMMPTIAPCHYPGTDVSLPDHGDLWRKPWEVVAQTDNTVSTRVHGDALAYGFERTLTLGVRSLHVDYRVSNHGERDLQFLWAAHPLFSVLPKTRVVIGEASDLRELHDSGEMSPVTWPESGVSVTEDLRRGHGRKLFARSAPRDASVSLIDADGGSLTLCWRGSEIPWLGVWLDNCSLSRGPVAAIEPTNAADDSLEVAAKTGQSWVIAPGAERRWSLSLTLSGAEVTSR
jgi:galactose mutarotase-like enzyme